MTYQQFELLGWSLVVLINIANLVCIIWGRKENPKFVIAFGLVGVALIVTGAFFID